MASEKKSVLFICLGNICRSPIAEAVFLDLLKNKGLLDEWVVDSAALGMWHVGLHPDKRAMDCLKSHNVEYSHVVRVINKEDFQRFDYIFGMDESNIKELKRKAPPNSKAEILLLGYYDPNRKTIIRDPYYDDNSLGFEECYKQCVRLCAAFLENASQPQ